MTSPTMELPDALFIEETDPPRDATPGENPDGTPEFPCYECGKALEYGGRGRKPKHCTPGNGGDPNCPTYKGTSSPTSSRRSSSRDVENALAVMEGVYDYAAMGLMFFSPTSATVLASGAETQQKRNRVCFESNPALAARIARLGGHGSTLAFFLTNALFLGNVGRIAFLEINASVSAGNNGAGSPDLSSLFSQFTGSG